MKTKKIIAGLMALTLTFGTTGFPETVKHITGGISSMMTADAALEEYEIEGTALACRYDTSIRELYIYKRPNAGGSTAIPDEYFKDNTEIRTVTLGDGVTEIGERAFSGCEYMTSIKFPSTLTNVGQYAFENAERLREVDLSGTNAYVDHCAFYGSGVYWITLSERQISDDDYYYLFTGASSIETVYIPKNYDNSGKFKARNIFGSFASDINGNVSYLPKLKTRLIVFTDSKTMQSELRKIPFKNHTTYEVDEAITGTALRYTMKNGKMTVYKDSSASGSTVIPDGYFQSIIDEYDIRKVVIDKGVTGIGKNAFKLEQITSHHMFLEMSNTVETIGESAFENWNLAKNLTLSSSLKSIGAKAFYGCQGAGNIEFPKSLVSIGDSAFVGDTSIYSVTFGENLKTIGKDAFYKTSLRSVVLDENITSIGTHAFGFVDSIVGGTTLDYQMKPNFQIFGKAGTAAETYCTANDISFMDIYTLETEIPGTRYSFTINAKGQLYIRRTSNYGKTSIPADTFSKNGTFSDLNQRITEVYFERYAMDMTEIGDSAFEGCTNLKKIYDLPENLEVIGESAFKGCMKLGRTEIPRTIKTIGDYAFYGCGNIDQIILPFKLQSIGEKALGYKLDGSKVPDFIICGYSKAADTYVKANGFFNASTDDYVPRTSDGNFFYFIIDYNNYLYIWKSEQCTGDPLFPAGQFGDIDKDTVVDIFFKEGIKGVAANAFQDFKNVTYVSLAKTMTTIGANAFTGFDSWRHISLSYASNITSIGEKAFGYDSEGNRYENVIFIAPKDSAGENYAKANGFRCLYNLNSVDSFGDSSLAYSIDDEGNMYILNYYSNGEPYIPEEAFYCGQRMDTVKTLYIEEGVTRIEEYAFFDCRKLEEVYIADSVEYIGVNAFYECDKLKRVHFGSGLRTIESGAFCGCALEELIIPENVEYIGDSAFYGRSPYTEAYILSDKIETIGNEAIGCYFKGGGEGTVVKEGSKIYGVRGTASQTYAEENGIDFVGLIPDTALAYTLDDEGVLTVFKHFDEGSTEIPDHAFDGYDQPKLRDSIKKIVIEDGVTAIGNSAFELLENLEEVVIGDTVTSIRHYAFELCPNLTSVKIGAGLKYFGNGAFRSCENLKDIYLYSKDISIINSYAIGYIYDVENSVNVPVEGFTIHGHSGTYAQTYANYNGFNFVSLCEHIDENKNGECDKCGEMIDGVSIIRGCTLNLQGRIGVKYYLQINDSIAADNIKVKFTVLDSDGNIVNEKTVKYSDASTQTVSGISCKVFMCDIAAKEMSQTITATVYNGSTEGTTYSYSAKDYLDYAYTNTSSTKLKTLITAMRNYGAAAQIQFKHDTGNLVAPLGTLTNVPDLSAYKASKVSYTDTSDVTLKGATLSLKSETSIKVYFNTKSGMDSCKFTVKDSKGNSVAYQISNDSNGDCIVIPNIAAKNLDEMFTITASKDGKKIVDVTYGAYSYIYQNASGTSDLANVCKALYAYNQAAKAYFGT